MKYVRKKPARHRWRSENKSIVDGGVTVRRRRQWRQMRGMGRKARVEAGDKEKRRRRQKTSDILLTGFDRGRSSALRGYASVAGTANIFTSQKNTSTAYAPVPSDDAIA